MTRTFVYICRWALKSQNFGLKLQLYFWYSKVGKRNIIVVVNIVTERFEEAAQTQIKLLLICVSGFRNFYGFKNLSF